MVLGGVLQRFMNINRFNYAVVRASFQQIVNLSGSNNLQSEGELRIEEILRNNLDVAEIQINDISGGCGSMYEVYVSSNDFKGKRTIQQHRIVNEILKHEVKEMHGLRILTTVPES